LRAVIWSWEGSNKELCDPIGHGIRVKVDIDTLIESVYIAPNSPEWYKSLVQTLMIKFALEKPLNHLILDQNPVY